MVLGLAYKKNTGDARESPAIQFVEPLLRMGAEVRGADEAAPVDAPADARGRPFGTGKPASESRPP